YWAGAPVENVALLPWSMATAFLHAVVIQERRGMLKVWNLSLVVGTFALTTFGTFLTRGSILSSVHAFAQSLVGPMYLGFLVVVLVAGFGLIAMQSWRLRSEGRFDSALSREAAFLGNNLVLLAVTFVVLLGTIFPLVVEAVTNRQSTVGGPYFEQTTVPLFLLLLFLMGVGPLLPWRRASREQLRRRVTVPAIAGAATMALVAVAGVRSLGATAAYGLATFAGYVLKYEGERQVSQPQRVVLIADVSVSKDGADLGRVTPSLNLYPAASEPIGTPSIRYGVARDFYASLIGFDGEGERATFR